MKRKSIALVFLLIFSLIFLGACADQDDDQHLDPEQPIQEELIEEEIFEQLDRIETEYQNGRQEIQQNGDHSYQSVSPFTGMPVEDEYYNRAIAVSIENSPAARPQSGINEAEIIYEFMLEGGITRFLAIFWPEVPEKIGPIRSARPFIIETAADYDALFLHAGASPDGFQMLNDIELMHLDEIYQSQYFWRSSKRRAPNNLYTGKSSLGDYLNNLDEREYPDQFNFITASVISNFSSAEEITIDYWGGYNVLYRYNSLENNYYRYINDFDTPHQVESGEHLTAKNIIVKYVDTYTKDEEGRQNINLNSNGDIKLFRDGTVINGNWERNSNNQLVYLDNNDNEIEINPGQTWIQLVPNGTEINY
ncbi:DUF3048 domain-containing protein [Halanaerobium hydrogeniformans]|uniref:Lipoprotein YerB n=1 Tax=Halanaerobium hydrogeniformans TaxID=656519 RepID=E4RIM3_HALHG|nr:DUF3048 domain-containing protein [Halanaerobium hydrogeniformans]ADQ15093.1 hypothetical protein Halsa_1670 [Halanaerobium hydrogeniformans]